MRLARGVVGLVVTAALGWGCTDEQQVAAPKGFAAALTASQSDFTYPKDPLRVEADPGVVQPQAVPYCTTRGIPIVCYSPNFIRTAYNFPSTIDGTGQTILIVDAFGSPTIQHDLTVFDQTFGIPAPPSFTIVCDPPGCPTFNPQNASHDQVGWSIETSLDVEWAHAMAPGANIVLVVASTSSGSAINTAEAKVIPQYPGSIMSQSFGIPEIVVHNNNAQIMQAHSNYQAAQAAGITVLASAGDGGATNGFSTANALFPSSDPLVTAVGGSQGDPYSFPASPASCSGGPCTTGLVAFTGTCGPGPRPGVPTGCTPTGYGAEQVWNEPVFRAATGGAPSVLFSLPSYQSGLGLTTRTTPDVSYDAAINGGVLVYYTALGTPIWFIVGGTSAGSPQWASIVALANQLKGAPLGFLNPTLYQVGCSGNYRQDFHDITVGNNQLVGTPVGFSASTGWDAASGWGTPNVANLIADLVTPPACE